MILTLYTEVVGVIINVFIYRINSYKIVSSRALKSKICYLESVVELEYPKHFFNYKKWSSLLWIRKVPYVYENVFVMTEICSFDVITLDNILQNSETEVLILRYLFISLMRCHVFHMGPQDKCSIGLNLMFKAGSKIGLKVSAIKLSMQYSGVWLLCRTVYFFSINLPS